MYAVIYPGQSITQNLFEVKYNLSASDAATYGNSIFQLAVLSIAILVGTVSDAVGFPAILLTVASCVICLVQLFFLTFSPEPVLMMMLLGVAYCGVAASLWPTLILTASPFCLGRVFGMVNSIQNTGLAIFPLAVSGILDAATPAAAALSGACLNFSHSNFENASGFAPGSLINCTNSTAAPVPTLDGYEKCLWLFLVTGLVGVAFGVALIVLDYKTERMLTLGATEIHELYAKKLILWKKEDQNDEMEDNATETKNATLVDSLSEGF
jgi:MFS family permease